MAQECECTKCQQAVHFKWLILSYVNLTSIKKKRTPEKLFIVTEMGCSSRHTIKSKDQDSGQHVKKVAVCASSGSVRVFMTREQTRVSVV